jgi:hypothetical protein
MRIPVLWGYIRIAEFQGFLFSATIIRLPKPFLFGSFPAPQEDAMDQSLFKNIAGSNPVSMNVDCAVGIGGRHERFTSS